MSDEVEASLFNLNMCGCIYQGPGTKLRLPLCCEGLLVASPNPMASILYGFFIIIQNVVLIICMRADHSYVT